MRVRTVGRWLGGFAIAASWVAASLPLDAGVLDLLPFMGPGALIGLTVGWGSYAFDRRRFHWLTGLRSGVAGLVILPPWLALLVALSGLTAASALALLVLGAWGAIVSGVAAALLRRLALALRRLGIELPPRPSFNRRRSRQFLPDEDA